MNIRNQLIFSYVGIVLFIIIVMYAYLVHSVDESLSQQITEELQVQANLTRELLLRAVPETPSYETVDPLVDQLGRAGMMRLTFIGRDGVVWGDTERDGQGLREMDNHANRPEVRQALAGEVGVIERYSNTLRTKMRYLAVPVLREGSIIGVCRVALPTRSVEAAVQGLNRRLFVASAIAIFVAVLLGFVITRTITQPIRELTAATREISGGGFTSRVPIPSSGELAQLSRCFNQMADRIQGQIHELSQERDRVENILAKMTDGVLLADRELSITYANPAVVEMLSITSDYREHKLTEIIRDPSLQHLLDQALTTGEAAVAELTLTGVTEHEAEITVVPISSEFLVVVHDVSHLRRLERVRTDFVANVSHELRTPLTSIQGYAETLLDGALRDEDTSQRFVEKILQQSTQLSQLIADLLDLSRLESGEVELRHEPCQIADLGESLLELFEPVLVESQLTLEWNMPSDLPEVSVDQQLIRQVFVNLIDNAIKYTPEGGTIRVSAEAKSRLIVRVQDTGIGIPSSDVSRVFERFYRVDKARSRALGGTGLGLSIAKHILLQHGGRIWVESTLGEGSTFHFALPLK